MTLLHHAVGFDKWQHIKQCGGSLTTIQTCTMHCNDHGMRKAKLTFQQSYSQQILQMPHSQGHRITYPAMLGRMMQAAAMWHVH